MVPWLMMIYVVIKNYSKVHDKGNFNGNYVLICILSAASNTRFRTTASNPNLCRSAHFRKLSPMAVVFNQLQH